MEANSGDDIGYLILIRRVGQCQLLGDPFPNDECISIFNESDTTTSRGMDWPPTELCSPPSTPAYAPHANNYLSHAPAKNDQTTLRIKEFLPVAELLILSEQIK